MVVNGSDKYKEREIMLNMLNKDDIFLTFALNFLVAQCLKSTLIYKRMKERHLIFIGDKSWPFIH